jgi:hypothetical protein
MKEILILLLFVAIVFGQEKRDVLIKFIPATKNNSLTQEELKKFSGNFITTLDKNNEDYIVVPQDRVNKKIQELKLFTKGYPVADIQKLSKAFDGGIVILAYIAKSQDKYKFALKMYGFDNEISEQNVVIKDIEADNFTDFMMEGNELATSLLKKTDFMKYVYYGGGAALIGGGVYFIIKSLKKESKPEADLPEPPRINLP